jgi:hypothetical protein
MRLRAMRVPLRARLLIRRKKPRSNEYLMAYLGAMCETSYQAKKRRNRTFYYGIVGFIPGFKIG